MNPNEIRELVKTIIDERCRTIGSVPIEVSARHVHLSQRDLDALFGAGYVLSPKRELSQPGQFLAEERVSVVSAKGVLRNVAILGPVREHTQVELSCTDARELGINAPIRLSGNTCGCPGVCLVAGERSIQAEECVMIAKNHIHMTVADAEVFGVKNGDTVQVEIRSARPVTFEDVSVRVSDKASLAMHIDFDEANACALQGGTTGDVRVGSAVAAAAPLASARDCAPLTEPKRAFLCEEDVMALCRDGIKMISVSRGTIITPLAWDYIRDHGMKTICEEENRQ